jgi:RNA polymerase sigma-70 factor (ECF subfamily)
MSELSDEELVLLYKAQSASPQGNAHLNELFARHHVRVAAWCFRMTGDRQGAADLAQDIFLKAFRHFGSFRGDSKFTTWLYTIARNHCTNELKSRATHPEESSDLELLNLADAAEAADVGLERKSSEQLVRQLMLQVLDETERNVMTWHYADELPLDAITRLLNLKNASGAKAYIVSAKRKLDTAIARWKARGQRAPTEEVRND